MSRSIFTYAAESTPMRLFRRLGMERIAWSLRRLHCPVEKNALVLEVGSGGNPYPRANVLLDAYEETVERVEQSLVKDRPLVLGLAEHLPFRDKSFDFVIASHVLEHSAEPDRFLKELMRVGNTGGYIETPDAFFERINPYTVHRLEVAKVGSKIRIFKKPSWRHEAFIVDEYERKFKNRAFIHYLSKHAASFHMRFYWCGRIDYEIVNPEVDAGWQLPQETFSRAVPVAGWKSRARELYLQTIRLLFSQNQRNKRIDVFRLLMCPTCGSDKLTSDATFLTCDHCSAQYPVKNGVPVMYPQATSKRME